MLFAEFVQTLSPYFQGNLRKSKFVENILQSIVKDKSIITLSYSSLDYYYDGKTKGKGEEKRIVGDSVCSLAAVIVNNIDVNKGKNNFCELFGQDKLTDNMKLMLCESFKDEIPDITVENYPQKLYDLLIRIMGEAALGIGNPSTNLTLKRNETITEAPDTNNTEIIEQHENVMQASIPALHEEENITETPDTNNTENIEQAEIVMQSSVLDSRNSEKIRELLTKLNELIDNLNSHSTVLYLCPCGSQEEKAKKEKAFLDLHREFDKKNSELRLYRFCVPHVTDAIDQLTLMAFELTFVYRHEVDENGRPCMRFDERVEEYRECLGKIIAAL